MEKIKNNNKNMSDSKLIKQELKRHFIQQKLFASSLPLILYITALFLYNIVLYFTIKKYKGRKKNEMESKNYDHRVYNDYFNENTIIYGRRI